MGKREKQMVKAYIEKRKGVERVLRVMSKVINEGIPESRACREEGLDIHRYRRFISTDWCAVAEDVPELKQDTPFFWEDRFMMDTFGEEYAVRSDFHEVYELASENLTEREKSVLADRYQEDMTYAELGEKYGLSTERMRSIVVHAQRKMKRFYRAFLYGLEYVREWAKNQALKEQKEEILVQLRQQNEMLEYFLEEAQPFVKDLAKEQIKSQEILRRSITSLDLSVRSYNALHRAGLSTIGDVAKLSETDLLRIRNMGRKSAEEIIERLKELGVR